MTGSRNRGVLTVAGRVSEAGRVPVESVGCRTLRLGVRWQARTPVRTARARRRPGGDARLDGGPSPPVQEGLGGAGTRGRSCPEGRERARGGSPSPAGESAAAPSLAASGCRVVQRPKMPQICPAARWLGSGPSPSIRRSRPVWGPGEVRESRFILASLQQLLVLCPPVEIASPPSTFYLCFLTI